MRIPHQLRRHWPVLLLAGLVFLFFGDLFLQGRTLMMRDTLCDFLPWRLFARGAWSAGHLPLWNPLSGFGKPFAADPQAAAFYPLHFLFHVLPAAWALKVSWSLHFWIAAASMYGLARYWRLQTAAALIAAVSFAFSTWVVAYMEFLSALTTAAWGPLVVWRALVVVDRLSDDVPDHAWLARVWRNRGAISILALVLAVQYLAGHPEMVMHTWLLTGMFLIVQCISRRNATTFKAAAATTIIAGALAAVVVLPQFLLSVELIQQSNRAVTIDPQLDVASASPKQFLGLLLPFAMGRPGYGNYWAPTIFEFWIGTCYVGILPLLLAGLAASVFRRKGSPEYSLHKQLFVTLIAILGVGVFMSLGQFTPLYSFVFSYVPGFDRIRWPSKYLLWVLYSLALLGALGYQVASFSARVTRSARRQWLDGIVVAIVFLNLLVVSRQIQPIESDEIYRTEGTRGPGVATDPADGRILSTYDGVQQSLYGRTDPNLFEWAQRAGAGDSWLPLGVYQVWQGGMNLQRYMTFLSIMQSGPPAKTERLADLAGVRFVAGGAPFDEVVKRPWTEVAIARRDGGMPRAYTVTRWNVIKNEADALAHLQEDTFDFRREAIVEPLDDSASADVAIPAPATTAFEPLGTVRVVADRMNGIHLQARVDRRALLVLGDAWYPGWEARVDGRRQPIFKADYLFRGIFLEPGDHRVSFEYDPWQMRYIPWLSAIVVAGLIATALSTTGRDRGTEARTKRESEFHK